MKMCLQFLLLCFLLSGCAKEYIIDQIKILQSFGIDIEGDTYLGSATCPTYDNIPKRGPSVLLTAESQTITGLLTGITTKSSDIIDLSQMRTLVIGEPFAKRGISELISNITQETMKSSNAKVVINKQKASMILSESLKYPSFYLSDLMEQNIVNGTTPLTNYHTLLSQYYGEGQDIYLPAITKDQKGLLQIDGLGVFKEDKFKLWLSKNEGWFIKLLKDKKLSGAYEFTNDQKDRFSFILISGKSKLSIVNEKAMVTLHLVITQVWRHIFPTPYLSRVSSVS